MKMALIVFALCLLFLLGNLLLLRDWPKRPRRDKPRKPATDQTPENNDSSEQ